MMVNFDIKSSFPFYKICSILDLDSTNVFHSVMKNIYKHNANAEQTATL